MNNIQCPTWAVCIEFPMMDRCSLRGILKPSLSPSPSQTLLVYAKWLDNSAGIPGNPGRGKPCSSHNSATVTSLDFTKSTRCVFWSKAGAAPIQMLAKEGYWLIFHKETGTLHSPCPPHAEAKTHSFFSELHQTSQLPITKMGI